MDTVAWLLFLQVTNENSALELRTKSSVQRLRKPALEKGACRGKRDLYASLKPLISLSKLQFL